MDFEEATNRRPRGPIYDPLEDRVTRFAVGARGLFWPVWNGSGTRLAGNRLDSREVVQVDPNGGADSVLMPGDRGAWRPPTSWSPDGRTLRLEQLVEGRGRDIRYLSWSDGPATHDYLATAVNEGSGVLSHDGRWIAYTSGVSGQQEIYVDRFPTPGVVRRVSQDVGSGWGSALAEKNMIWWGSGDRELVFLGRDGNSIYSVDIRTTPELTVGAPRQVFRVPSTARAVALAADAQRCLVAMPVGRIPSSLTVVQNWTRQLAGDRWR